MFRDGDAEINVVIEAGYIVTKDIISGSAGDCHASLECRNVSTKSLPQSEKRAFWLRKFQAMRS